VYNVTNHFGNIFYTHYHVLLIFSTFLQLVVFVSTVNCSGLIIHYWPLYKRAPRMRSPLLLVNFYQKGTQNYTLRVRKFHACLDAKSNIVFYLPSFHGVSLLNGQRPPHYRGFTITLRHTTRGRIPVDAWSARIVSSSYI
jgi:hypothetical protein